jgi:transcriptional regulator with GAF, ATPase, and Fis domain
VLDLVAQVAPSRSTILIPGETGTGKELIAKAIHANSPRVDHLFVAVNSGSLPTDLLESTLFGHVKGAFTSACNQEGLLRSRRQGHHFFRRDRHHRPGNADQAAARDSGEGVHAARLDRADQGGRADSGGDQCRSFQLVKEGKFREDLYYRLNVININLPPLRERKEDIPLLVDHFFTYYCRENSKYLDPTTKRSVLQFQPEAMQVLMEHSWPGNVRELENVVERAVVLATDASVARWTCCPIRCWKPTACACTAAKAPRFPPMRRCLRSCNDYERRVILERLEQCNWSQTEAAESLHVPLSTLNQKIKRLDIKIRTFPRMPWPVGLSQHSHFPPTPSFGHTG